MQTVVFYMGLGCLPAICEELITHGRAATTPIALIEKGTTAQQRVFVGTLATMLELLSVEAVQSPSLIIVGEVVALRDSLQWFAGGQ